MSGDKPLLRRSSTQNLKEKVVKYYESVFQATDPCKDNRNFWNEFFLLKANMEALEGQFSQATPPQLQSAKGNINDLFIKCVDCLNEKQSIKTFNAMQTMCGLVKGAFSTAKGDYGFSTIDLLIGFDEAETVMQSLMDNIDSLLRSADCSVSLKNMCLRFLLTIVTVTDSISQNTILEYLMLYSIFDTLLLILSEPSLRSYHGNDAVVLLLLLVQYRKYESTNPYIVNLSILDSDIALNGLSQIIASSLLGHNRQYVEKLSLQKPTGLMSSFTSMVGSMFSSEEAPKIKVKPDIPLLLALYEAVHLNRNFVPALTTSHASSISTLPAQSVDGDKTPPAIPTTTEVPSTSNSQELDQPTNLLATFIEYTSIVVHDVRDTTMFNVSKLCFIILTCVSEDQYACSLMHDPNINFRVPIHKLPMRHRKITYETNSPCAPLTCSVIDLQVEFIVSHMMKTLPAELYIQALGIIHRLLIYQKKSRVRLNYPWKNLWSALTNLVKFMLANESALLKICNIFQIAQKIVNIFNMFITYGDTFLATPNNYDELYYELIRTRLIYDNLYSLALRFSSVDQWKDDATYLIHIMGNIRAVISHFNPKVESWAAVNHLSSLTEEQVLEVVRTNYETLTLKVHEMLDQYGRYSEKPKHTNFFLQMVRSLVQDVREKAAIGKLEQANLLKEFSMLSP